MFGQCKKPKQGFKPQFLTLFLFISLFFLFSNFVFSSNYDIQGSNFNLFFNNNESFQIQDDYFIIFEITEGQLNASVSNLIAHRGGGQLTFSSFNNTKIRITSERDGKTEGLIKVTGCTFSNNIADVKTGNHVVISWDFGLRYPNYVPMLFGIFGVILFIISPSYLIHKFKEGEYAEGIAWALVMFIIGWGFIIYWLWG
jgi:hypothetical protein